MILQIFLTTSCKTLTSIPNLPVCGRDHCPLATWPISSRDFAIDDIAGAAVPPLKLRDGFLWTVALNLSEG